MKRKYVVSGRVQGVGYRTFVQRLALTNDLEGEVWNTRLGTVEIVVSGEDQHVLQFESKLRFGPGHVDAVAVEEYGGPVPAGFEIGDTR